MADQTPLKTRLDTLAQAAKEQQKAANVNALENAKLTTGPRVEPVILDQRGLPTT